MKSDLVIAVDGPAASGKGTIAARLAAHYGLPYLDTGLLYRAVGLAVLARGGNLDDALQAAAVAQVLDLAALENPALIGRAAGDAASRVGFHPPVRAALLKLQRDFAAQSGGAVLDGRDIGTVIAPDADVKIYVTADPEVRARRRWRQLTARGEPVAFEDILADIRARDARDAGRDAAPMVAAQDAVLLNTTDLGIDAAFEAACRIVEEARARQG
ncbi:MAG: (d)CMP kinase [Caulobacterales bacterium]|nr:(d)CMP kinase [Caulobacterales bacterium]